MPSKPEGFFLHFGNFRNDRYYSRTSWRWIWLGPDDWETLATGLFALLAALMTVQQINCQIRQTQKIESDRLERENFAARATLPIALYELADYAQQHVQSALAQLDDNDSSVTTGPPTPKPPENLVATFQACITYADKNGKRDELADLLSFLQLQIARSSSTGQTGLIERILDALELYARTSSLFTYARRDDKDSDEWQSIYSAARRCWIYSGTYNKLDERINQASLTFEKKMESYRSKMKRHGRCQP